MLLSFPDSIDKILDLGLSIEPKKIMDIGSGFGKMGLLFKEAIASQRSTADNLNPDLSDIIIDSCENAEYFHNVGWIKEIYRNCYTCSCFDISKEELNKYDLILLIDVIEHWTKEEYEKFIDGITTNILISTPKDIGEDKVLHYGFEAHKTQFKLEDFKYKHSREAQASHIVLI